MSSAQAPLPIAPSCSREFEVSIGCRPLLTAAQTRSLEAMFKTLANGTRLRLLHALIREPELCVSEIAERLEMKPQAVSNQLQRLTDRGILASRRNGTQVHYTIVDCCVTPLLTYGLCLAQDTGTVPGIEESNHG